MPTTTQRTRRTVRIAQRRLALPTLRSAIGATLVVAAAAGVLSVYSASTQPPSTRFTVAARNLPAGHVLRTGDLGAVAVALPDGTSAVPADRAATLIGRRTTSAIHRADLLRRGDVAAPVDESDAGVIVPIAIDVNRSPGRGVIPGSLVTVLSTDSEGAGTVTVAERALVVSVDTDSDTGATTAQRVRLRVPDATAATRLVDAAVRSTLTLTLPGPARKETPSERTNRP